MLPFSCQYFNDVPCSCNTLFVAKMAVIVFMNDSTWFQSKFNESWVVGASRNFSDVEVAASVAQLVVAAALNYSHCSKSSHQNGQKTQEDQRDVH